MKADEDIVARAKAIDEAYYGRDKVAAGALFNEAYDELSPENWGVVVAPT